MILKPNFKLFDFKLSHFNLFDFCCVWGWLSCSVVASPLPHLAINGIALLATQMQSSAALAGRRGLPERSFLVKMSGRHKYNRQVDL
jgi:hypothetical protein